MFIKEKVVNYNSLLDMKEDTEGELNESQIYPFKSNGPGLYKKSRSSKLKSFIRPEDYPDVCNQLLTLIKKWNPSRLDADYTVLEFNYLIYNKGDHFIRHRDKIRQGDHPLRIYSTSTLISQSEDFEGGELIVFDEDDNPINTDLQVGETAFFDSMTPHQVNPVTKGTREVLVAWIYKKSDVQKYTNRI